MTQSPSAAAAADIDVGLRRYMLKVYNYMSVGLVVTGLIALLVAEHKELFNAVTYSPLRWVVIFAPIGFAMLFGFRIQQMRAVTAEILYWAFAAVMGLSLSYIFVLYTNASVARVFFITAGTFAGMSLYGYTTKRDLTSMGSFMVMGLFGLILAMLVNLFMQSAALYFAISLIGVVIFVGLTAWDTQKIKEMYSASDAADVSTKKAILGAFQLYLDFINLFVI
ncbi:MAG TPA: Bax inhibitor-1/YccA family protein, partial [Candidatus Polarisedimenticolia bacterium]|nr:Bax inhibitor-1/YccA family protein [Candidatus Polarisedimenticolia bacterium]